MMPNRIRIRITTSGTGTNPRSASAVSGASTAARPISTRVGMALAIMPRVFVP
jgi:hypothetical protein